MELYLGPPEMQIEKNFEGVQATDEYDPNPGPIVWRYRTWVNDQWRGEIIRTGELTAIGPHYIYLIRMNDIPIPAIQYAVFCHAFLKISNGGRY